MTASTVLAAGDILPLTCTRAGTCCHGKVVWINPWELAALARARDRAPRAFRDEHTQDGGIRLRFAGAPGWRGLPACSQYDAAARGCRAWAGRPLACRLYPLGRERRQDAVRYVHEGRRFPCLDGCPAVETLPRLTVADYVAGQGAAPGEATQDAYLEVMQDLAEGAFVLLFDSGLAAGGDTATLPRWRASARQPPGRRAEGLPAAWLDRLVLPDLPWQDDGAAFARAHRAQLQEAAQAAFATLRTPDAVRDASCLMMALALHLATALGMDAGQLGETFIGTARGNGAA